MSSLRNAVKRITHKERSQPRSRAHLGHLERKKDYVERAKEYHKKQDAVNLLRQKASMRNPDEFYFGMHKAQVGQDGKHHKTLQAKQEEFDATIGMDTIRIMKDQDLAYVRMQRAKDEKKIQRLKATLHQLGDTTENREEAGATKKRKHTIFVESKQEAQDFDAAQHFDTLPDLVGRAHNRPRVAQVQQMAQQQQEANAAAAVDLRPLKKARAAAYQELEARTKRVQALKQAEAHLVTEKLVSSKGRKRKIKPAENGQPAQYVWRTKRLG